jgi:hypothetical protein
VSLIEDSASAAGSLLPKREYAFGFDCVPERGAALRALGAALLCGAVVIGTAAGHRWLEVRTEMVSPVVAPVDLRALFFDDRPVRFTVTAGYFAIPVVASHDAVRSDRALWRRMEVSDWDQLPAPLRNDGLEALLSTYRHVLASPPVWDRMSPRDWDHVPPPVRALAFRHMVQYWTGYYDVGRKYGLPPALLADTAAAIVMSESWFDHRAEHVNAWGNRDIGLGQASGFARAKLVELHERGASDVVLADEDYYNPWAATRFVAIWLSHVLDEVDGDLPAAVRAYHRGVRNARRGEGQEYLDAVIRRRRVYLQAPRAGGAWGFIWQRDRELTREAWPWLRSRRLAGRSGAPDGGIDGPVDRVATWSTSALQSAPIVHSAPLR